MQTKTHIKRAVEARLPVVKLRSPLGFTLQRYRRAKGLGLNELARLAKVDPAQLSRLENASQVSAHATTLRKLAKVLELDIELLMRLSTMSGKDEWTTDNAEELLLQSVPSSKSELDAAIEQDPTIPKSRKKWLHECVALARSN